MPVPGRIHTEAHEHDPLTFAIIGCASDGHPVGRSFRPDFIVGKAVVVELKAASAISPIHQSQVLSYMRASKLEFGLIINFNVEILIRGVKRLILTKSE